MQTKAAENKQEFNSFFLHSKADLTNCSKVLEGLRLRRSRKKILASKKKKSFSEFDIFSSDFEKSLGKQFRGSKNSVITQHRSEPLFLGAAKQSKHEETSEHKQSRLNLIELMYRNIKRKSLFTELLLSTDL